MMSNTFSIPSSKHLALNVDKLKAEYQELMKQKNELTSTYKKCEKEVQSLNRKLENLNQYLVRHSPILPQSSLGKRIIPSCSLLMLNPCIILNLLLQMFRRDYGKYRL